MIPDHLGEATEIFELQTFEHHGETYTLKKPLECVLSLDEGRYKLENKYFDIWVHGYSKEQVEEALKEEMAFLYHGYYKEDDERLSKCAQYLKQKLGEYFTDSP